MQQHTLILGRMPSPHEGASPGTHLAAGPWCFVGQETLFPEWEHRYTFGPEPLEDPAALERAARQARALMARSLPLLTRELRPEAPPLPDAFWDIFLGTWLISASMQVIIYGQRAQALVEWWGRESLRVPLLPAACDFHFAREQDFIFGGALGHAFTHWLLSRMLEPLWPDTWEKVILPLPDREERHHAPSAPQGWRARLTEYVRSVTLRGLMGLPFPRIKGFDFRQSCAFSWALLHNRNPVDHAVPSADFVDEATGLPPLSLDPLPLLRMSMPMSIRTANLPRRITPTRRPRLRVGSVMMFDDTRYRLRLARWRGAGHKLTFIQHGGNYGNVRSSAILPLTEYGQHAFITWGWTRHTPLQGNFVPLPHGQLDRLRNAHQERTGSLLYVGTEITVFTYRMDSRPSPRQYVQYREDKKCFFETLGKDIRRHSQYRPYFDVPGTLEDAPWLLPQFPDVHLCIGPLDSHMLTCRLLVLDHHGTTLELAMAANVPLVLFWNRLSWPLCPETDALLNVLAEARIWHPTAEGAAEHVRHIWNDVGAWWSSPPVSEARARWSAAYALTVEGGIDSVWIQTLKTL